MVRDNVVTAQGESENYTCLKKIIALENKYRSINSKASNEPFVIKCSSNLNMIGTSSINCTFNKNLTVAELIDYFNSGSIIVNVGDENYLGYTTQTAVKPIEFVLNPVSFMWNLFFYSPVYNSSTGTYGLLKYTVVVSPNSINNLSSKIATISIYRG